MGVRKAIGVAAVALSAMVAAVLPGAPAHAASWCGDGWLAITSYSGPSGGSFNHMLIRVCIQKATFGEYFAGDITLYNGVTSNGHFNGRYGSRHISFGSTGNRAMFGVDMGPVGNSTKNIKGPVGHPTNDCYYGELMPGYQIACSSAWVLDDSPSTPNHIVGIAFVGGYFWQAGMSQWEWATGYAVRTSSTLD